MQRLNLVTVLFLVLVVFVIGLFLGRSLANPDINELQDLLRASELNTESYVLERELLGGVSGEGCTLAKLRVQDLSSQLFTLGQKLNSENPQKALGTANYNVLKRKFHLMQIKTYFLFYNLKQNCNVTPHVILFYYGQQDAVSLEQGSILDQVVASYDVTVFAVEYNYSNDITFLERYYNVTSVPAIVVDYQTVKQGIQSYDAVTSLLSRKK